MLGVSSLHDPLVGRMVSHYRILECVGAGGMGVVYRADDTRVGRTVAVKFLRDEIEEASGARARFKREAIAVSTLHHPNICAFLDFGQHDDQWFLVTEFLEGETLAQLLENGPLPPERILDLAGDLLDGLKAAHAKGFVHRDIQASNVFVTIDGQAKLLDFGLSKPFGPRPASGPDAPILTERGTLAGTVPYMSPEQLRNEPLDARTDLFSTGVLIYEMAAGVRPFDRGSPAATIAAIQNEDADLASVERRMGREFGRFVARLLAKDTARRLTDAGEALEHFRRIRSGHRRRTTWYRRTAVGLTGLVVIGLVYVAAVPHLIDGWTVDVQDTASDSREIPNWNALTVESLLSLGHSYLERRTPDGLDTAVELFSRVIYRDPELAPGWSGRAHALVVSGTSGYASERLIGLMDQARIDVEQALDLDEDLAEALMVRATIRMSRDHDWEGARSDFEAALAREPELAEIHHWYALYLAATGAVDEALAAAEQAQRLRPQSAVFRAARARIHYYRREYAESEALYREALELEPESVPTRLGLTVLFLGRGRLLDALRVNLNELSIGLEDSQTLISAVRNLLSRGRSREGEELIEEFARNEGRVLSSLDLAFVYAFLHDQNRTLEWLEKAEDEQSDYLNFIAVDPLFDHIRDNPRYTALLRRLGLPISG